MFHVWIIKAVDSETKRKMIGGSVAATIVAASFVVMLGFLGGVFSPYRYSQNEGELVGGSLLAFNESVTTSFGSYMQFLEDYTPNAPLYSVDPGLTNIINRVQFPYLSSQDVAYLEENGFVVIPQDDYDQIYQILSDIKDENIPSFITSDAVLHAFHVCYDLALREAEVYSFWDLLGNMTTSLLETSIEQYNDAPVGMWKEAARLNMIYLTIAAVLLDNSTAIHPDVASDVAETLNLIESAEEMTADWFMGYREDFTQYIPRGHYTRSEILTKYFLAMMWYGRVQFRLDAQYDSSPTRQAILLTLGLSENIASLGSGIIGYDVWDAIYEPTAFFVGAADDLTPPEYHQLILDIYGESPIWTTLENESLLTEFIAAAIDLRDPMILGSPRNDTESANVTKGMRLMGQRFIPDSYVLGELVYDKVGTRFNPRLMPSGLDVMAAFWSERAYELQEDEKEYANYDSQMEMLRGYILDMTAEDWTQNLYYLWMYSLLPLLSTPANGLPFFMQNQAWIDKELNTALASWTELRHDTILYAKQSYTVEIGSIQPPPPNPHGYVEPMPELYSRLASLCAMMLDGLDCRDLASDRVRAKLLSLQSFLLELKSIAIKELTGVALNTTDYDLIMNAHSTLLYVSSFPTDAMITSDTDEFMSLIADVHTDPNSQEVLEEAVGNPMLIIVAVPVDGQIVLARGGTFSYYEFTHPMDDRLTDEAWQEMLSIGNEPDFPEWTTSFISSTQIPIIYALAHSKRNP